MVAGGASFGRDFRVANRYKTWMVETGFVQVVEKIVLVPVNVWPVDRKDKLLGHWYSMDVLRFLDGSKKILQAGGYPLEDIPSFLEEVRNSSLDASLRCYVPRKSIPAKCPCTQCHSCTPASNRPFPDYIVYGQKPELPVK